MGKNYLYAAGYIAILIIVFAYWLTLSQPTDLEIENLRNPIAPLPTVNLNELDDPEFQSREVFGDIPVNLDNASLGREDPYESF